MVMFLESLQTLALFLIVYELCYLNDNNDEQED